jgi:hypothetical protein
MEGDKMKKRILAASLLSIVMCGSLIAGATMALFTSESETNIAITSGNVDVKASVAIVGGKSLSAVTSYQKEGDDKNYATVDGVEVELKDSDYYTLNGDDAKHSGYYLYKTAATSVDENGNTKVTFENKGTATISGNKLELNAITPGDSLQLAVTVTNYSNVTANYRIKFYCSDKDSNGNAVTDYNLFDSLDITVPVTNGGSYQKASLSGVKSYTTAWEPLGVTTTDVISATDADGTVVSNATVELPLSIQKEAENKSCSIYYVVEAVQGNANLGDNQIELEYIDSNKSGAGKVVKVVADTSTEVTVAKALSNNVQTSEQDSTETAATDVTVKIPKSATTTKKDDDTSTTADSVQVTVTNTTVDDISKKYEVSVNEGSTVYAFDVDATIDGKEAGAITAEEGTDLTADDLYSTSFTVGEDLSIDYVWHKGSQLTTKANDDGEFYTYENGVVTVYTKSFSPFIISYLFGGGKGTKDKPYLISTVKQLQNLKNGTDYKNYNYYKLVNDITFSEDDILVAEDAYGSFNCFISNKLKYVSIFGQNHSIDLNNQQSFFVYYTFYSTLNDIVIKNIKKPLILEAQYSTLFNNVDIESGNITLSNNQSLYVQYEQLAYAGKYVYTSKITFVGCDVKKDVVMQGEGAAEGYNAVFVGYLMPEISGYTVNHVFSFTNCTFSGTYTSGKASMFIGNYNCQNLNLTVNNCVNYGTIRATYTKYNETTDKIEIIPDNEFCGTGLDSGKTIELVLNGTTYTDVATIKTLSVTDKDNGGSFNYGPIDTTLKLTQNSDGTFTITPSTNENVAYYVVSFTIYTKLKAGGTLIQSVKETIDVTNGATSYITTLKNWKFVDSTWLEANTSFKKSEETSFNGFYIVSDGTTSYYLINDEDKCTLNGEFGTYNMVGVTAYDANGNIIASTSL